MGRVTLLFCLALLAATSFAWPSASAGVAFELSYEDPRDDVAAPSADVLRFTSRAAGARIEQRIEMAARPSAPNDTIILRNWFHDSQNGSFHVLDIEVHGTAGFTGERFSAFLRRGDFNNITPVEATYGLDGATWVFSFDAALVADATCFDPLVWSQHQRSEGPPVVDQAFVSPRACHTRGDPPLPVPRSIVAETPRGTPPPTIDPPGTRSPAPGLSILALLLGAAAAALMVERARGGRRP